jgi:hypothetical protein
MIRLPIGRGNTVDISEPTRAQFSDNLSGAVQFALAHLLYSILAFWGGALGSFVGGIVVQFLETIEPGLVKYTTPLLDKILSLPDLDPSLRLFFSQLRSPTDEAATTILSGLASQAGGAITGAVLNTLLAPVTKALNVAIRPAIPSVSDLLTMTYRNAISFDTAKGFFAQLGYPDNLTDVYYQGFRPRAGANELLDAWRRGLIGDGDASIRLSRLGYTQSDIDLFKGLQYRLLGADDIVVAFYRGLIPLASVREYLKSTGIKDSEVDLYMGLVRPMPGANDLVRFGVREAYSDQVSAQFGYDADYPAEFERDMGKLGFDSTWSRRFWRAHWDLPSATMGYEMLHRGIIDSSTLELLLRVLDYPQYWREKLIRLSYNPLTRVDTRRVFKLGLINRDQVKRNYLDLGYDEQKAEWLTQFAESLEEDDGSNRLAKHKEISTSIILSAYSKGILSQSEATTRLQALLYKDEDIALMLALEDAKNVIDHTPDYEKEYRNDVKNIVERAYSKRILDRPTALLILSNAGISAQEADYALTVDDLLKGEQYQERMINRIQKFYTERVIDRTEVVNQLGRLNIAGAQQNELLSEWDVDRENRTGHLSRSQYEDLYYLKVIDLDMYKEHMRQLGYSEQAVQYLSILLTWSEMHPVT